MLESTRQLRALRKTIGQNIHHLRVKRRISLTKLATQLNINPELVDRYELGGGQVSMEFLSRVAAVLSVNITALFEPIGDY